MKNQIIKGAAGTAAACALGALAAGLVAGCQSPPPVREYRVAKQTVCNPCTRACTTNTHVTEVLRNTSMWPVAEPPTGQPYLFTPRPRFNPPVPTRCTSALQEYPDGVRHLAGGPLYYETQNLNWEQSPPFGRW